MSKESMRAVLLNGVKDMRLEDVDLPEVGSGEVLVRVRAAIIDSGPIGVMHMQLAKRLGSERGSCLR